MKKIRRIYFLRKTAPKAGILALVLVGSTFFISFVNVINNTLTVASKTDLSAMVRFFMTAFMQTELTTYIILFIAASAAILIIRDIQHVRGLGEI